MAGINNISSSNDYSSLFASLSTTDSSNSSSSSFLTDWASIKNGSYGKLTKAYYGKNNAPSIDKEEATKQIKTNTSLKGDASGLESAVNSLTSSKSLFEEKITKKDADGNEIEDYDYDKIYSMVKSFVDNYNSVIKAGADSDNKTILRNTLQMTKLTSSNSNVLSSIGITVGKDNTLSLDETAAKKANISGYKSLFASAGAYGDMIGVNASNIVKAVNAENNKLSNYTSDGTYSSTDYVGKLYDGNY